MEPTRVKQDQLGDGETNNVLKRLLQCEREITQMEKRVLASARERRSSAAELMRPGWVPQSTAPDTRSKERQARPQTNQPDSSGSAAGWQIAKLPSFDGTTNWEAFHAQVTVLSKLCSWSEGDKAQQLMATLRGDA
ncbi:UNVERIFIED_CONTAM: hypothetical protein FKN15_003838 [Acipenser sinensis]